MGSLFHIPTLLGLISALFGVYRRPTAQVYLLGACGTAMIGLFAAILAYGGHHFGTMRAGCWLLFAYTPIFTLASAPGLRPATPRLSRALIVMALGQLAVGAWSFVVEPRWLEVSRHTVLSDKIERPLRIAVVADLQTDRIGAYERRALEAVMAEQPDLILMPGDYLQVGRGGDYRREAQRFRGLLEEVGFSAPLGVFAVRGDVEMDGWESLFADTGIRTFEKTTRIELPELVITAISPRDARLRRAWPRRTEKFHLAFGHAPEFALDQEQLDKPSADLLVAGHTHGGQVRLPFIGPLVTFSSVPRSWAAGRTDFDNQGILIVSRGVGMERGQAPRLRFLCRPEIVLIDVMPGSNAVGSAASPHPRNSVDIRLSRRTSQKGSGPAIRL